MNDIEFAKYIIYLSDATTRSKDQVFDWVSRNEKELATLRARVAELEKCLGLGWQADRLSDGSWVFNKIVE